MLDLRVHLRVRAAQAPRRARAPQAPRPRAPRVARVDARLVRAPRDAEAAQMQAEGVYRAPPDLDVGQRERKGEDRERVGKVSFAAASPSPISPTKGKDGESKREGRTEHVESV